MKRNKEAERLAAALLVTVGGVMAAYEAASVERAEIDLTTGNGRYLELEMEGGRLVIYEIGETHYYPRGTFIDLGPRGVIALTYGGEETQSRVVWKKLGEAEINFKPAVYCWQRWRWGKWTETRMGDCGVEYVTLKPAGDGRMEVEVHLAGGGVWRRWVRLVSGVVEEAKDVWDQWSDALGEYGGGSY